MSGIIPPIQQFNPSVQAAQSLLGEPNIAPVQQTNVRNFAETMADANRQLLTMENFLKYRLIGQEVSGFNKGIQAMSGMVTAVTESGKGFAVKVFDSRRRNQGVFEIPVYFQESKSGPTELVDREQLRMHLERVERLKKESYINSSELVELPVNNSHQTIQSPQPYQRLSETVEYIDKNGKTKKGSLILKDNKLYLDNGSEVVIKFGNHD